MRNRLLALTLALIFASALIPASAQSRSTAEKESLYNGAIAELETYLETYQNDTEQLDAIAANFDELANYRQSKFFRYYTLSLKLIIQENFSYELEVYLDLLGNDKEFTDYLTEVATLGTLDQMKSYASGRELESEGKTEEAAKAYRECGQFYDASERYISLIGVQNEGKYEEAMQLMREGKYVEAYLAFRELQPFGDSELMMGSIERILGYTPGAETEVPAGASTATPAPTAAATEIPAPDPVTGLKVDDKAENSVRLTWKYDHSIDAVFAVYWRLNGTEDWGSPWYTRDRELQVNNLNSNTEYDFRVIAIVNDIQSKGKLLRAVRTGGATPVPTEVPQLILEIKNSKTTNTLSWNGIDGASYYEVQRHGPKGEYETIADRVTETSYKDSGLKAKTRYYYTVIAHLANGKTIESNEGVITTSSGSSSSKPTTAPKPTEPRPTNVPSATQTPAPVAVTEYRYRDSSQQYSEWSAWGSWTQSRKSISNANLMEEQSKMRYGWWAAKCNSCSQHNPYHGSSRKCANCGASLATYSSAFVWTDSTGPTQTLMGRSGGMMISGKPYWRSGTQDDRMHYRYRTRTLSTVWGSWSAWSTTRPASASNREIEERTVYR